MQGNRAKQGSLREKNKNYREENRLSGREVMQVLCVGVSNVSKEGTERGVCACNWAC